MKTLIKRVLPKTIIGALRSFKFRLQYGGKRHKCEICGRELGKFEPGGFGFAVLTELNVVGGGPRAAYRCPFCGSIDRERLLIHYLRGSQRLQSIDSVLHIAPEKNLRAVFTEASLTKYVTADLVRQDVDCNFDITSIPFESHLFDLVICSHVLEHVPEDRRAMKEVLRVLAPNGLAILQVPVALNLRHTIEDLSVTEPAERERRFGQEDHVRIYGPDYPNILRQSGFDVECFSAADTYGLEKVHRLGFIPNEKLYLCTRPQDTQGIKN